MVESSRSPRDKNQQPGSTGSGRPQRGASNGHALQLLVTLDPTTHDVISLERVDNGGQRRQLAASDWAELTSTDDDLETLVEAVEEAYEAGVADALGEADSEDDFDEDDVLVDLIGMGAARRPRRSGVRLVALRQLLLRHLLRSSAGEASSTADQRRKPPITKHARNGSDSTTHHAH